MAPKKKEQQQKLTISEFLGSWADEVEENVDVGTQALPPTDRPRYGGSSGGGGGFSSSSTSAWQDRGYSVREAGPQIIPDRPPFTAHVGNLAYDITDSAVNDFFEGCEVVSVRLIEDRELQRPKGFGYVEFADVEGLKKALALDGESFQGRTVRIKVADPPRGGDSGRGDTIREVDWVRKGPLAGGPDRGARPEFGERRPPREPGFEGRPARDLTWERHGPLAPVAQPEGSDSREGSRPPRQGGEGMGERSDSHRGGRRDAPAWGEGRQQDDSRPARREFTERPERPERQERAPTAADKDMQWRDRMRPAAAAAAKSPEGSAPPSPALSNAAPVGGRPRLNLTKRTVSEATASPTTTSDSKASPFGAARPINTAAREKEIEEKRVQALQEKKEADEKAKEERRLAKEAAAKAEAEAAEAAEAAKAAESEASKAEATKAEGETESAEKPNGEQKAPTKGREPRDNAANAKPRSSEAASNWRSAGGDRRPSAGGRGGRGGGAPRGGRNDSRTDIRTENRPARSNGAAAQPQPAAAEAKPVPADDDGFTLVMKRQR